MGQVIYSIWKNNINHIQFKKKQTHLSLLCVRAVLSSRTVASQVFSPLMSLTTVFGMGTGVPSSPLTRTYFSFPEKNAKEKRIRSV